jgi:hypothetical protein
MTFFNSWFILIFRTASDSLYTMFYGERDFGDLLEPQTGGEEILVINMTTGAKEQHNLQKH